MTERALRWVARALGRRLYEVAADVAQATLPAFANRPRNLTIEPPRTIANASHIHVGDDVWIGPGSLLIAVTSYPGPSIQHPTVPRPVQQFTPRIAIGHRVTATAGLQIAAHASVTVEDDVLFASNVNLTDGLHGHARADEPYKYQPISRIAPILVGQGCWIGQNVVVLPGVTIGELSIVGANSVVRESIPPRSIAVGQPARVVKRWDESTGEWVRVGAGDGSREARQSRMGVA